MHTIWLSVFVCLRSITSLRKRAQSKNSKRIVKIYSLQIMQCCFYKSKTPFSPQNRHFAKWCKEKPQIALSMPEAYSKLLSKYWAALICSVVELSFNPLYRVVADSVEQNNVSCSRTEVNSKVRKGGDNDEIDGMPWILASAVGMMKAKYP